MGWLAVSFDREQARAAAPTRQGDASMHLTPIPFSLQLAIALVVLLLDVGVVIYCLNDLYKPERRVNGYSKDIWAVIIIIGGLIGWALYFLYGRIDS
jgi:hypothetical protein